MATVKTSYICPFCDLNFPASHSLQNHIGECGNTLIICTDCGMAIQRRMILNHQDVCPMQMKNEFRYLKEIDSMQIEELKCETNRLQQKLELSEQRNKIFSKALHTIRLKLDDYDSTYIEQQALIQNLCNSVSKIEVYLDSLRTTIDQDHINHSHLELIVNGQDSKIRSLQKLDEELSDLKDAFESQAKSTNNDLYQLNEHLKNHDEKIKKEHEDDKEKVLTEIVEKFSLIEDEVSKIKLLKLDTKDMKSKMQENSLQLCEIKEKIYEMEEKISIVETKEPVMLYSNPSESNVASKSGHFIWRIDDYENKMKSSVDKKTGLFSQIFYSHEYGYALQAEVHLNGLGRWRGRHMTISVFLVNGEYDPILPFPVKLEADIILKDQTPNRQQAIDVVKSLIVKRKETNTSNRRSSTLESSKKGQTLDESIRRQYVFIPHTALDKLDYIKNNVMFVEVVVKK